MVFLVIGETMEFFISGVKIFDYLCGRSDSGFLFYIVYKISFDGLEV